MIANRRIGPALLVLSLVVAAVTTSGMVTPAVAEPIAAAAASGPTNGFAADGPWNTQMPARTPVADNSAAVIANIKSDIQNDYGTWGINTSSYSAPIYVAGADAPTQDWAFNDCQNKGYLAAPFAASLKAVPTLPDMIASDGTDQEIVIYQPSTSSYWDFWHAQKDATGQWSACWGGKIADYPSNPGIFSDNLGAAATGLPLGGSLIRVSELQQGVIDHAISMAVVHARRDCTSWPAQRNDGATTGADYPCEGQRLRLDPSFDVSTLSNPAARTIAKAMQDYGVIITDKGGAVVSFAEDPRPYMATHDGDNPYFAPGLALLGAHSYDVIPPSLLDHMQALPLNYGESGYDDTTPPVVQPSIDPAQPTGTNGWWTAPVSVSATATDDFGGSVAIEYRVDAGDWVPYTKPVVVGDGKHVVQVRGTDLAGNVSDPVSESVDVDATAPTVTVSGITDGQLYGDSDDLAVSWHATDSGSGLASTVGRLDGTPVDSGDPLALHHLTLGMHTLRVVAVDTAGNQTTHDVTFFVTTSFRDMESLTTGFAATGQLSAPAATDLQKLIGKAREQDGKGQDAKAIASLKAFTGTVNSEVTDADAHDTLVRDADAMIRQLGGTP